MWRRRLRLGIAVFGIGLAAFVVFAMRPREVRVPVAAIDRVDPAATVETRGCDVVQMKGSRQDLRVECESQATYADGRTMLKGVTLTVDNRAGRTFVVTGNEAGMGANQSSFDMSGDVKLAASDGLQATAGSASYLQSEGIVRAPGPVEFNRGRMAGAGIGFTFDEQRDTVWLLDQAVVRFGAEGEEGPMDVASGAAGFARGDRYMRFERGVRMNRSGQIIEADEATVFLFPDRDEPDRIELRGNARITGGEGMGAVRAMRARDINLDYGDDGRTLEQATLAGQSAVELAGAGAAPGQRLSAEFTAVSLDAGGAITSLSSRDRVVVTLPADKDAPARTIRSVQLTGSGGAGQGLTAMRFENAVEFREAALKDRGARIARARVLDARIDGATGNLNDARFSGGFMFEDGALRAQSGDAQYNIGAGTLVLRNKDNNASPFVRDEAVRIDGDAIDVTLSPRRMAAKGSVRSVLQAASNTAGTRRPALLGDTEPVNVLAGEMTYDEQARKAVYSGGARLLQGDTVIQADTITLDEARGDLSGTGKVLTSLQLTPEDSTAKPAPTLLRAETFRYGDESRRAIYDTKAQMNGEQGDLHADHIELILKRDENGLDRLEARGSVQITMEKRRASGATLIYRPADARYEITGNPGRFDDECNESAGKTLTFFRSSDRVIIDGNEEVRTETRGGKCTPKSPN
ncbi:MAG: LPS export ABC transporter periplasmic protein LptC [Acidobacteria bacterium]|nr:LPS export ABC transporter periplasmic protein LptC [Acidobacteriota bacterium]